MENFSKSAGEILNKLTLQYNSNRHAKVDVIASNV
jgi:F0F1-type ATP synthase gamma subunit